MLEGKSYAWPTKRGGYEIIYPDEPFLFTVDPQRDVRGAMVGIEDNCAAARALRRQEGVKWAWVKAFRTALMMEDGTVHVYRNPTNLTHNVRTFDVQAGLFPAGTYALYPLNPADRPNQRKKRAKSLSANTGKRKHRARPVYQFR